VVVMLCFEINLSYSAVVVTLIWIYLVGFENELDMAAFSY
jgi:hypothetical protein